MGAQVLSNAELIAILLWTGVAGENAVQVAEGLGSDPRHGLTAADFELFEDGQPMSIETFHEINVPVERADRTLTAP